jgi:transcriptional regulator with XRE-family HTH domain
MANFEIMSTLHENIRDLMRLHGFTQEDLADKMDVKQSAVARLLNNPNANPTVNTLMLIASAFNVEVSDLLRKKRKKVAI